MQRRPLTDEPFTRADLEASGISLAVLRQAVRTGRIRRVLRGVYVDDRVPDTVGLRVLAMKRVVSPGHIACDRSAAWMHGVDMLGVTGTRALPPIEVAALRGSPVTDRREIHGRNRDLAARDVQDLDGVLVTTPLRTALDLGCVLRRRDALAALDQFRRIFGLSEHDVMCEVPRYFRRRGVIQLRELIPLSDPLSESVRESWTRLAIHDAGLPKPVLQHEIEVDGVLWCRLDLAYLDRRVAVEYDGEEFHHTPEQLEHDARRRTWLADEGWHSVVVRRGDFTGARLQGWTTELADALRPSYSNLRW
jgi:hypothetical protein